MKILSEGAAAFLILFIGCFFLLPSASYAERLKDISTISGVRDNQLVGYGLVVGLDRTGDKSGSVRQALSNMYQRAGINIDPGRLKPKNVAAVMVTADMPTFSKLGSRLDVIVSSLSDAKSLQGGTLLMTPLKGPDGNVYAVAQGAVSIGGFAGGSGGGTVTKNHPTVGRVPSGALIEKEVPLSFADMSSIDIVLYTQDFTTVQSVINKIDEALQGTYATAEGPSSVTVQVPADYQGRVVDLLALLETVEVETDIPAKVVINEKTGTVVLGDRVTVSPVALSHGNLIVQVKTTFEVSQPTALSNTGQTVIIPDTETTVVETDTRLVPVSGANLSEVVRALNSLGVTPRDLIAILQALKAVGALKAELEIL